MSATLLIANGYEDAEDEDAIDTLALAAADLECAAAALAGVWAHCRAAGRLDLADAIPGILSQLRGVGKGIEAGAVGHGSPPADWFLRN